MEALGPLAAPAALGQLFGEGLGLETAMAAVSSAFLDAADVRQAGTMIALDILTAADKGIGPPQLDQVMGLNSLQGNHLAPDALKAAESLAGAAKTFLGQFDEDGANIWELWKKNDEVAAEFLCWHTVARLRLATAELLPAVTMPT